jgi:ADP-ribose pyrophosphatase YjhB (NUDIX family)
MNREYPATPFIGVGAVIVQDGRVLLIRRAKAPLLGEWSLPGGVLECGEMLRDATKREVLEETGLAVEVDDMLGIYERIIPGDDGRTRYHYVLIDFLCRPAGGEPQAGSDAAEVRWFSSDELPALHLPKDTTEVVRNGLTLAKSRTTDFPS